MKYFSDCRSDGGGEPSTGSDTTKYSECEDTRRVCASSVAYLCVYLCVCVAGVGDGVRWEQHETKVLAAEKDHNK